MVDANRNLSSARPFTPLGTNGALPSLPAPQMQLPQLASIPDQTPELLARTQQSVDNAFRYQAQALQTAAQAGAAEAANRTQSNAGQTFGAALSAIGSGIQLYTQLDSERKKRIAEENIAIEQQRVERAKSVIQLQIEEVADEMFNSLGNTAALEGGISTLRQFAGSLRNTNLPPEVVTELSKLAYGYTREAQRTLGTRQLAQAEELQSMELDVLANNAKLRVSTTLNGLLDPTRDPNQVILDAETQVVGLLDGLPYREQMYIYNQVDDVISEALLQRGVSDQEFNNRARRRDEFRQRLDEVLYRTQGNTNERNLQIALLQQDYSDVAPSGLANLFPTELEELQYRRGLREEREALGDNIVANIPEAQAFYQANGTLRAATWLLNPASNAGAIDAARESDDPIDRQAVAIFDLHQTNVAEIRDINTDLGELNVRNAQIQAEAEKLRDAADPNRVGPAVGTDNWTREFFVWANQEIRQGRISEPTLRSSLQALQTEYNNNRAEFQRLQERKGALAIPITEAGLAIDTTALPTAIIRLQGQIDELTPAYQDALQRATLEYQQQILAPPNFSPGVGVSTPPVTPLSINDDGVIFPIQATHTGNFTITSNRGVRTLNGTTRMHYGIDIAPTNPSADMGARTVAGGRVILTATGDFGGFGGTVAVRTPDGYVEQYAHLRDIHVTEGEYIAPGESVGLIGGGRGDRWGGRTTGRHLDFMVYKPETPDDQIARGNYAETTIHPLDYLRSRGQQIQVSSTGVGRPPNQPAPGTSNPFDANQQLYGGQYAPGGIRRGSAVGGPQTEHAAAVRVQAQVSTKRNPYREGIVRNTGEGNFGYSTLRENSEVRLALHRTASRLGIPAQWLADLIDYETAGTWSAGIRNRLGCIGLQFCPTGELRQVAQDQGFGTTEYGLEQARKYLERIGLVGQIELLGDYFVRYANNGEDLHSIKHLYAGWNGGPSMIRNPERLPSDGNVPAGVRPIDHHIQNMGGRAGRRYDLQSRGPDYGHTHTTYHGDCPLCREQLQRFNRVMPHIGVA